MTFCTVVITVGARAVSVRMETTEPAATTRAADAMALGLRVFALFLGIFFSRAEPEQAGVAG